MRRLFRLAGVSRRRPIAALSGTVVVALAAAGFAYSTGGPDALFVHQDRLYGGGGTDAGCFVPDIGFCRSGPTDFSLDAHATSGGPAGGDLTSRTGQHGEVTCLAVDGRNAVVGGRIDESTNPSQIGLLTLTYYVDNGPGQLDQVSPTYTGPPDPSGWPQGFPSRCPSPDVDTPAFGLIRSFLPISRGNIVVRDGE